MSSESTVITVSQLTFAIKNQLESRFPNVTVQGEISNSKLHSSGHFYFDLKDSQAKIPAVMFRCQLPKMPKEGDQVTVQGALSVYPPHGKYQLIVKKLELTGIGALLLQLEHLKKKLTELGWFDQEKKKPLPKFPKRIGVVTSPTGAVIKDIIHVLSRRLGGFHLILNPVHVQGAEAPGEIAQAIEQFNQYNLVDVLIVGRGGGSLEDLWAFNEEVVAKAIFESRIPIVSAVGHETDVTIADFVADVRAPTPSAAAEIVGAEKIHHLESLAKIRQGISHALSHLVKRSRTRLEGISRHPTFATSHGLLGAPMQRLDETKARLDEKMHQELLKRRYLLTVRQKEAAALKPTTQIHHFRQKLHSFGKSLDNLSLNSLKMRKQRLKQITLQLKALDPKNVLKRGYSILFALNEGSVIVSAHELSPGREIRALLSDGEVKLKVQDE